MFCIKAKTMGMSTESNCVPYIFPNRNWPLKSARANLINPVSRSSEVGKRHFRQSTQMPEKNCLSLLWPFIKFPTFPHFCHHKYNPYLKQLFLAQTLVCVCRRAVKQEQEGAEENKSHTPSFSPNPEVPMALVIRMSLSPGSSYPFPAILYFFHPSPATEYPFLSLDLLLKEKFYFISLCAQWFSITKHSASI